MSELPSGELHELVLGMTPPSSNTTKGLHWTAAQRSRDEWRGYLFIALLEAKVPKPLARVHATAELRFPSNRRRDEGNFRASLEKALGDALQIQWLADDTPEFFTFGKLTFAEEVGPKQTTIHLEVVRAE